MLVKIPVLGAQAWSGMLQCAGMTEDSSRNTKLQSAEVVYRLLLWTRVKATRGK